MPLSDRRTHADFEGLSWPSVPDYEYECEFNPLVTFDPLPVTKTLLVPKRNNDHVVRPGCHSDDRLLHKVRSNLTTWLFSDVFHDRD